MYKEDILIRKMNRSDVAELSDLWLKTSLIAHDFISDSYWIGNRTLMELECLPNAEVYVAGEKDNIHDFIALVENQIASLFIDNEHQGKGIGSLLLEYAKELHTELTLNVYQKNEKSVNFYKSKDFKTLSETIDQPTGEKEFAMQWNRTVK